jgi:phosphoglycerol transferase MdoB-like AlkP superfamily enzyme
MPKIKLTQHIKWILLNFLFLFLIFTCYRLFLFKKFAPSNNVISFGTIWYGLRYDLRTILVILLPIYLLTGFTYISPFRNANTRPFWTKFLTFIYTLIIVVFVLDYQWYAYRSNRLDGELIGLAKDAGISLKMVWQSYPVVKILFAFIITFYLIKYLVKKIMQRSNKFSTYTLKPYKGILSTFFTILIMGFIYGKISQFPLRWSDAFSLNNDFKATMALNPFQSFFSSLKFAEEKPNIENTKKYYKTIAAAFQLPQSDTGLNFTRIVQNPKNPNPPNVVIVLCESFSYYKSSMSGNPLNATPFFNQLSKEGAFFSNCFSPAYGTARGVWATITGIPDVTQTKTATRNPKAVKQHTIMNDFDGYQKNYFIGGDATWANIRGLIKNNIDGVKLYEQFDYNSPVIDVWGVSDRDLFTEATKVLNNNRKPFISIIQTADNHKPYSIPKKDGLDMGLQNKPLDSLLQYGFNIEKNAKKTNEEFNALRYFDFCINEFITNAKKETWFNNTIFLFVGDHGLRGNSGTLLPKVYNEKGLTCEHIPMLIYGPNFVQPAQYDFPCSQLDVLPTVAGLAGISYKNSTLGRDILKVAKDSTAPKFAFIFDHDTKEYGVIAHNNYYVKQLKGKKEELLPINPAMPSNTPISYYQNLANGILETSKWLMFNNK